MKVVIINGYPETGKDSFAVMCGEVVPVKQVWTSELSKHTLTTLELSKEKPFESRRVLGMLKEQVLRYSNEGGIIFVHSGEPQEIAHFRNEFNALTVCIVHEPKEPLYNDDDNDVKDFIYDFYIDDSGSLDNNLRKWAHMFAELVGRS